MDTIDKKILALLQEDGRLSVTEIADKISLSLSATHRRIRNMEENQIITGYQATIDPQQIGLGFSALVFITLKSGDSKSVQMLEDAIIGVPQIVQAERLFGDPDYLLHIYTKNLAAFQQLYDERLSKLPSVQRLTSTLVMKTVIRDRAITSLAENETLSDFKR